MLQGSDTHLKGIPLEGGSGSTVFTPQTESKQATRTHKYMETMFMSRTEVAPLALLLLLSEVSILMISSWSNLRGLSGRPDSFGTQSTTQSNESVDRMAESPSSSPRLLTVSNQDCVSSGMYGCSLLSHMSSGGSVGRPDTEDEEEECWNGQVATCT